jgi:hypothetical protein
MRRHTARDNAPRYAGETSFTLITVTNCDCQLAFFPRCLLLMRSCEAKDPSAPCESGLQTVMEGDCTDTVRVDLPTVPLRKLPVGPGHPCLDGVADLQGCQTCEQRDSVPQGIIGLPCVIMASFFVSFFLENAFSDIKRLGCYYNCESNHVQHLRTLVSGSAQDFLKRVAIHGPSSHSVPVTPSGLF